MNVRNDPSVKTSAQARPATATSQRRGPARPIGFCGTQPRVTPLLPIAMVLVSTAIAYPHPRHTRRSALGPVRPARWSGPKLPHAFPTNPRNLCCTSGAVVGVRYGSGMGQMGEDQRATSDVAEPVKESPATSSAPCDAAPPLPRESVAGKP